MAPLESSKRLKLLFIAVNCDEDFFGPVRRGMADAAAQMGVEAEFTGTVGVDAAGMTAIARRGLEQGVDGLAIVVFDADAFAPVIAEARSRGVPVVAFNIDAGRGKAGTLSSIAQDFPAAGRALARRVAADIRPGSTVLLTMHDPGISALEERRDGIKAGLANHGIEWVETITGHYPEEAARHVLRILAQRPEISAVLATGQADTEGAALAAERMSRPVYAAGFDLSPTILRLIEAGHLACTTDQQPYAQGLYPVIQLVLNIRYGLLPVDMDAGAAIIDRTNVARIGALSEAGFR
ncbi:ABC transporter substrate-binding protein [Labrys miyagiensis]|uniref:ABC transporter substrate-binding protein n=1 Tax=Labrys miyagiensis TaxID=346912 RepID=A0ABQ6CAT9_9HYPH|nr:substrate-binding domain-containing protein [Labrys miyagiensis]GLS17070.1 ABC transporter substrate-binding protein [Labrys miyagiensis]